MTDLFNVTIRQLTETAAVKNESPAPQDCEIASPCFASRSLSRIEPVLVRGSASNNLSSVYHAPANKKGGQTTAKRF